MTKQDALRQIEALKAFVKACDEEKEYFEMEEKYWFVNIEGFLGYWYFRNDEKDENLIQMGNAFHTESEAEKYKLRLQSMAQKTYLPKMGEKYWTITYCGITDEIWKQDFYDRHHYFSGMVFKTKEECEQWIEKYKSAWELEEKQ